MADQMKFCVTPEQTEAAKTKLAEAGFPIVGDSGAVEKDGYRIGYSLAGGVLVLDVQAKPRMVPMWVVKSRIRSVMEKQSILQQAQ